MTEDSRSPRRRQRPAPVAGAAAAGLNSSKVLYWIYAVRLVVALGVYMAAILVGDIWLAGEGLEPGVRTISVIGLGIALLVTSLSYWHSHLRKAPPKLPFLTVQAGVDILLVTGIVHITGGPQSVLGPPLYIALVSGYALLLPLPAALAVAVATGAAYLADVAFAYPEFVDAVVLIQVGIFTAVALASGVIGGKLRAAGRELQSLEGELRRLRLGTSDILRAIDSGVVTVDREGRPVYVNPAAEELLDLRGADWVGKDLLEELDERAPAVVAAVRETFRTGAPVRHQDAEILRADRGDHRPAAVSTRLLEPVGAPALVTAVLQDMRMARQLEELHLRAGRLEAVAELSASLAHEIKNPLTSIRSAVEQLAGGVPDDEENVVLSRLIVRETDRLSRLLEEFNDFARVDVIQRKPLDLPRVMDEVVELVRRRPEALGRAEFEVRAEGPLDDLWGDPDLIHRTLFNLVLNAVQVSAQDDRPVRVRMVADCLRAKEIPREVTAGVPVRVRVMDDGPGIAPDELDRIFDPFYTRREGGSGMGLAIAHRAIHAHGGALLASSEPGRGATFVIILPRRDWRERQELESQGWPTAAGTSGATVPAMHVSHEGSHRHE